MTQAHSYQRAIIFSLLAHTIWTLADSGTRLAGKANLPTSQIIVVASVFYVATIFLASLSRGRVSALKPRRLKLEALRGLLYTAQSFVNVMAFTHLPLATVYTGLFTTPMIVALLSALILRETLSWMAVAAIMAGFGGVVLALLPGYESAGMNGAIGFVALVLFPMLASVNVVFMRYLGRTETVESMAFFPQLMRIFLILPLCAIQFQAMTWNDIGSLMMLGFFGAIGMLLMSSALKQAPAGIVSPYQYSQLISGAILGYLIWNDVPKLNLFAGAGVIVIAGIYLARSTRQIKTRQPVVDIAA